MKKISKNEMSTIIDKRVPLGVFYREDKNNKTEQKLFIGVDNRTGEAWTEEFKTVKELKEWFGFEATAYRLANELGIEI